MSKGQTLRALVNARLTAAAEDIFALFERTIAENEEELCRSKQEIQRKQELLDSALKTLKALSPRAVMNRDGVQLLSLSPGPDLNLEIPAIPQIKEESEEQSVKQVQVSVLESSAVCVKTEESSLLQQTQTEPKEEETQGEDISSDSHFYSACCSDTVNDEDWKPPLRDSAAQMETEADGDPYIQVQIRDTITAAQNSGLSSKYKNASETSVNNGHIPGTAEGAETKKHHSSVCRTRFGSKQDFQMHFRVHAGEKTFSCSICTKTFAVKGNLTTHMRTHTGEKPYSCSICMKSFAHFNGLKYHNRTHTGERPYSCSICKKDFTDSSGLRCHQRTHTGEKPYSCSICKKVFASSFGLKYHKRTQPNCKETMKPVTNINAYERTHCFNL